MSNDPDALPAPPEKGEPAGDRAGPTPVTGATEARTRQRGPRRAVRRGAERETVWGVTADEQGGHDSNDDRLRRDVPPHW